MAYRLLRPGRRAAPTWCTVLTSRGSHALFASRLTLACKRWTPASSAGRALAAPLRGGLALATRACQIASLSEVNVFGVAPEIEGGVYLSPRGHLVIGARSIGAGTVIHDHVTVGRGVNCDDVPAIGRRVWIGPGSVIYGRITIGDGATVLPYSVLSRSLPPRCVARGNPATVVRRDYDNSRLLLSADPAPAALEELA